MMMCSESRLKLIGLLLANVAMLGVCYVCVFVHGGLIAAVAGWVGFLFFGSTFLVIVWQSARAGDRGIVSDVGIEYRRNNVGVIPWSDIVAIEMRWTGSARFLCVDVRDSSACLARMTIKGRIAAWANGLLGYPAISIPFVAMSPPIDEVLSYIMRHHPPPGVSGVGASDLEKAHGLSDRIPKPRVTNHDG